MGWFKKRSDVLDLTDRYRKQQEKARAIKSEQETTSDSTQTTTGGFGVFGMATPTPSSSSESSNDSGYVDVSSSDDKRKKLAKRLMAITDKLEEISNQIYHLQQRVELLEKKNNLGY